ncbi:hypothetical protein POJ06DRAFT_256694 [Lipomyces tetrasporus]|uniref:Uncharacterized protein n=1 Tax=Lipomyces tetrasporus TaxID=54092 RepID=A0AAD7QQ31_9ASCO|nr:uncharacterized protein POJ06DRAFT_256694 [Lipomyces tetrasporus]KAJ8099335.1 hypothetical protein POJ06DRAFT_256694 [Lipomyces tetrasporus]
MIPWVIGNVTGMLSGSPSSKKDNTSRTATSTAATSPPPPPPTAGSPVSDSRDINPLNDTAHLDNSPTTTQLPPGLADPPLPSITKPAPESATSVDTNDVPQKIRQFVDERPNERYIFDGDDHHTKLCRFEEGGRKCLNLAAPTKDVLVQMQKMDFYCALGQDVGRSEIECSKM